jgi:hypothetical protein
LRLLLFSLKNQGLKKLWYANHLCKNRTDFWSVRIGWISIILGLSNWIDFCLDYPLYPSVCSPPIADFCPRSFSRKVAFPDCPGSYRDEPTISRVEFSSAGILHLRGAPIYWGVPTRLLPLVTEIQIFYFIEDYKHSGTGFLKQKKAGVLLFSMPFIRGYPPSDGSKRIFSFHW